MRCRLVRDMQCRPDDKFPCGVKPCGTVIDHPDAWKLVRMGVAAPDDSECDSAAAMSDHAQARARHAYERLSLGIHPDDFASFDAGYMVGYNQDGSWIPGPNFAEWQMQQLDGD